MIEKLYSPVFKTAGPCVPVKAQVFPQAVLSENCLLLGADNVQAGKIISNLIIHQMLFSLLLDWSKHGT